MTQYITVGKIINTHGVRGEVKILSSTDFPEERFEKGNHLFIDYNGEYLQVTSNTHRQHKGMELVTFDSYNDISDVEKFKGCKLYIKDSELQELEEDEYYFFELEDCIVYDQNNIEVGVVEEVRRIGPNELLVLKGKSNKKVFVPFVDEFIKDVDIKNKNIRIKTIEGMI